MLDATMENAATRMDRAQKIRADPLSDVAAKDVRISRTRSDCVYSFFAADDCGEGSLVQGRWTYTSAGCPAVHGVSSV